MPDQPPVQDPSFDRAVACYKAGKRAQARVLCEAILSRTAGDASARHLLGIITLEAGRLEEGISHLELAVASKPDFPGAYALLAQALARAGREREAVDALKAALARKPEDAGCRVALAGLLSRLKDFAAARKVLEPALEQAPDDPSLLNNLGGLHAQCGEPDKAVDLFERAVQADEARALSHYNLAKALRDSGRPERALAHYKRVVELDPGFEKAWRNLGNLYLDIGEVALGAKAYDRGTLTKWSPNAKRAPDQSQVRTSRSKLQHDIEQLDYLLVRKRIDPAYERVLDGYRTVFAGLPKTGGKSRIVEVRPEHRKYLAPCFNRLIHRSDVQALTGPAVNPDLDAAAVEADYGKNAPGMTCADGFLTGEALRELRRFCLESTVWYRHGFAKGYVGAFMEDGFVCPLLLQIADELRRTFPGIFGGHTLRKLWAFKYDSRLSGIPIHADFAAVNVNFWITPDCANRDPGTGGLIVWDKEAPLEWDFKAYNTDEQAMRSFLADSDAQPYVVPHRENRMVMFNSDLFHETGELNFEEGYENRRINITMLYGKRENTA